MSLRTFQLLIFTAAAIFLFIGLALAGESGIASVYHTYDSDQNGTTTASGIPLNNKALTAAYWNAPLRSKVRVTNVKNGRSVVLTITDRGPAKWTHRLIDLTQAAADAIGCPGLCLVTVEPVQ